MGSHARMAINAVIEQSITGSPGACTLGLEPNLINRRSGLLPSASIACHHPTMHASPKIPTIVHISFICDTYIRRPIRSVSTNNLCEHARNLYPWTPGLLLPSSTAGIGPRRANHHGQSDKARQGRGTNTTSWGSPGINMSSESVNEAWRSILSTSMDFHLSRLAFLILDPCKSAQLTRYLGERQRLLCLGQEPRSEGSS